jgi:hypothetical protein
VEELELVGPVCKELGGEADAALWERYDLRIEANGSEYLLEAERGVDLPAAEGRPALHAQANRLHRVSPPVEGGEPTHLSLYLGTWMHIAFWQGER